MGDSFKIYLATTGIAAALVLLFPPIVFVGFIFFIIPGFFLAYSPLLFSYGLAWWLVRTPLLWTAGLAGVDPRRWATRLGSGALALAVVATPAALVPHILNAPAEEALVRLQASDVETAGPIELPDVVAIVLQDDRLSGIRSDDLCETLCQRLLFNGAAKRVIVDIQRQPGSKRADMPSRSFSIERKDHCPNPPLSRREIIWPGDHHASRPLQRVRARIAAGECLVEAAGPVEQAELTIAYRVVDDAWSVLSQPWALPVDTIEANRVEITDADGNVLYRRTEVHAGLLSTPLGVTSGMSLLSSVRYFGWSRRSVSYSEIDLNGRKVLRDLLGEAARPPDLPAIRGPR